jgi:hypothetical protein
VQSKSNDTPTILLDLFFDGMELKAHSMSKSNLFLEEAKTFPVCFTFTLAYLPVRLRLLFWFESLGASPHC